MTKDEELKNYGTNSPKENMELEYENGYSKKQGNAKNATVTLPHLKQNNIQSILCDLKKRKTNLMKLQENDKRNIFERENKRDQRKSVFKVQSYPSDENKMRQFSCEGNGSKDILQKMEKNCEFKIDDPTRNDRIERQIVINKPNVVTTISQVTDEKHVRFSSDRTCSNTKQVSNNINQVSNIEINQDNNVSDKTKGRMSCTIELLGVSDDTDHSTDEEKKNIQSCLNNTNKVDIAEKKLIFTKNHSLCGANDIHNHSDSSDSWDC